MAISEIIDSIVKRFDKIEEIISQLYNDARVVMDEDRDGHSRIRIKSNPNPK